MAGSFALAGALGGPDKPKPVSGPTNAPFRVTVPETWRTFSQAELSALPAKPLAVMQRKDGKGFMVVRAEGAVPKSFESFASDLDRQFESKLPDFQKRTSRTLKIKAGPAFFYSYIRKRGGNVRTVVLVPAGSRSYALNTVAQGGEDDVFTYFATDESGGTMYRSNGSAWVQIAPGTSAISRTIALPRGSHPADLDQSARRGHRALRAR